jgi:hypothetical protein
MFRRDRLAKEATLSPSVLPSRCWALAHVWRWPHDPAAEIDALERAIAFFLFLEPTRFSFYLDASLAPAK